MRWCLLYVVAVGRTRVWVATIVESLTHCQQSTVNMHYGQGVQGSCRTCAKISLESEIYNEIARGSYLSPEGIFG